MKSRHGLIAALVLLLLSVPAVAGSQGPGPLGDAAVRGEASGQSTDCGFDRRPVEGDKQAVSPGAPNPLQGEDFYLDNKRSRFGHKGFREPAAGDFADFTGAKQALIGKIALTPRFFWFGKFSGDSLTPGRGLDDLRLRVCTFIADAEAAGQVPLITTLRHQGRECNARYQGGGVQEDNATRAWFDAFADAVGRSRVVIAYEPDATGTVECLARSRRAARIQLLRDGIDRLSQLPNATIYIEATASDWKPVGEVVRKLRQIGVGKVRGFLLNVTHFDWTNANLRYGSKISRRLGGKHFIVNTSSNGRGPVHFFRRLGRRNRRITINCHPLFRGLGPKPTTATGNSRADALMWVSRPGYSSGKCNGGPRTGDWWGERALQLARLATARRGPVPGTRFGFPKGKYTARQVAGTQFLGDKF